MEPFTLKELCLEEVNLNISSRVKILELHNMIPWALVCDLWQSWFDTHWDQLGTHQHFTNPELLCVETHTFGRKLLHNFQCEFFRDMDQFRDSIFAEGDVLCFWHHYYKSKIGRTCLKCINKYNSLHFKYDFLRRRGLVYLRAKRIIDHKSVNYREFKDLVEMEKNWCCLCLRKPNFKLTPKSLCSSYLHEEIFSSEEEDFSEDE